MGMLHLMKYQFLHTVRERANMFWAFAFPIILGSLFYVSFGNGDMGEDMEALRTAVVEETEDSAGKENFLAFLEELDGDVLETEQMEEKEALAKLKADEIDGIFYAGREPELTVAKSEMEQNILKALLDTYQRNAEVMQTAGEKHPEAMGAAADALREWERTTKEVSVGGRTLDPGISYFFALIAYAALSGIYLGIQSCCDSQPNLSALGARRCITPTHKLKLILCSFVVLFFIQFINVMVLTGVVRFLFHMDLGGNVAGIILINLLGSMIGVSVGILLGSISHLQMGMKIGFGVFFTLFTAFLAGLMFGNMKNLIEQRCPIINRINPAAVLSDSYYCLAVYNDTSRMTRNLLILAVMCTGCVVVSFLVIRRERYDSI